MIATSRKSSWETAILVAAACLLFNACSCMGNRVSRDEVEAINGVFRGSVSSLNEAMAFRRTLEGFSFEKTDFLDDTLSQIQGSRDVSNTLFVSIEELQAISYKGRLSNLGAYILEYCDAAIDAQGELETVLNGLESVLRVVEPVLREEIVITKFETQQITTEILQRLINIREALETSLVNLDGVDVPEILAGYKSFYGDLLTAMHEITVGNIAALQGQASNFHAEVSPDLARVQQLMSDYPQLIEDILDSLKISRVDPLVERVELEINRLFLEEVQ